MQAVLFSADEQQKAEAIEKANTISLAVEKGQKACAELDKIIAKLEQEKTWWEFHQPNANSLFGFANKVVTHKVSVKENKIQGLKKLKLQVMSGEAIKVDFNSVETMRICQGFMYKN